MGDSAHPPYECFSYVGRVVSKPGQIVNLGSPDCLSVGRILHETLHALGLPFFSKSNHNQYIGAGHEISRPDRDTYVKINYDNIQPDAIENFGLRNDLFSAMGKTSFDVNSIMMLGPTEFGILDSSGKRKTTIQSKIPGVEIR